MARVQGHRQGPGPKVHPQPHSMTGVRTRPGPRLQAVSNIQVQTPLNHRRRHRKGTNPRARIRTDANEGHVPYRQVHQHTLLPQRSSLRRALRESLGPSDDAQLRELSSRDLRASPASSTDTANRPDSAQGALQTPAQGFERRTRVVKSIIKAKAAQHGVTATRSSVFGYCSTLNLKPQRSSLRRAIRASPEAIDASPGNLNLSTEDLKPRLAQPPSRGPAGKPKVELQNKIAKKGNDHKYRRPSDSRDETIPPAKPQRSSLRRAVRESLYAATRNSTDVDTALIVLAEAAEMSSDQDIVLKKDINEFLPSSDDERSDNSLSECSSALSSDASLTLLKGLTSDSSSESSAPSFQPSLFKSTSSPCFSPTLDLDCESDSPTNVARHQALILAPKDKSIVTNDRFQDSPSHLQSTSMRKGWHRVHEIVNDAPGGLYLVDWEGQDPRTGVMWPASWVRAKDVSENAIRDWERRKHQMLIGKGEI
ncbi:hypothetical protein HD806DRAFT_506411 [Xylariaceae sp. AK1471]|nr:hypothetical protein HD806DRAFT_506411 [Xylariaceae sp. AK1471]